jgi:hypothetical protein
VKPSSRSGQWWRMPVEKLQVTRLTAAHTAFELRATPQRMRVLRRCYLLGFRGLRDGWFC